MNLEQKETHLRKMLIEAGAYSDNLLENLLAYTDKDFKRSGSLACPRCQCTFSVSFELKPKRVTLLDGEVFNAKGQPPSANPPKFPVSPLVQELAGTPLSLALQDAFEQMPSALRPKNIAKHLVKMLERCVRLTKVPKSVLVQLINEHGTPDVKLYGTSLMCIVLTDGEFRQFIPTSVIKGLAMTGLASNGVEVTETKARISSEVWIRTRYGYVAQRGIFFEAMRQRCIGDFTK